MLFTSKEISLVRACKNRRAKRGVRYPNQVKKKIFDLFEQGVSAREISSELPIPIATLKLWNKRCSKRTPSPEAPIPKALFIKKKVVECEESETVHKRDHEKKAFQNVSSPCKKHFQVSFPNGVQATGELSIDDLLRLGGVQ